MAKITKLQNNFTGGEISPLLFGREDINKYQNSVQTLENFIPQPYGGITKRTGTKYVAEAKFRNKACRLIKFEFNTEQSYILELGNYYMRFYTQQGQIESGGSPLEVATPWSSTEVFDIQVAQKNDVMYMVHASYPQRKLERTSNLVWTLTEIKPYEFTGGPFLPTNTTAITMTPSATTGAVTITASAAFFQTGHVDSIMQMTHGATTGYAKITAFTSSTVVSATVIEDYGGSTAVDDWAEGAWSGVQGYPSVVTFHEQRLVQAGSTGKPQTAWGSVINEFENYTSGTDDDDSYSYTISSNQVNIIEWVVSQGDLAVGTSGGIFSFGSGSDSVPITPSNIVVRRKTTYGSNSVVPKTIGSFPYYVQRNGNTVREFRYSIDLDADRALDMTLYAEHITKTSIVDMDFQQDPYNILWCVRNDGVLVAMTRMFDQEVLAWSRHITTGTFESVGVIPKSDGKDEVWVIVNRTIGGDARRYVEYFVADDFDDEEDDLFYVDSGLTYDGVAATIISGLDHLEGLEVAVLGNGAVMANKTVSGGSITLDASVTKAQVGLPFTAKITTLPISGGSQIGTGQTKVKRIYQVGFRVYKSIGFKFGRDGVYEDVDFRTTEAMDSATGLVSDDKILKFNHGYDRKGEMTVVHEQPLPLKLLFLAQYLDVFDE